MWAWCLGEGAQYPVGRDRHVTAWFNTFCAPSLGHAHSLGAGEVQGASVRRVHRLRAHAVQDEEGHSGGSSAGMSQQLDFLMSSMRSKIQNAVSEMQAQLQEELQEEELKIYHVLGQGAFGTVYHGAVPSMLRFFWVLRSDFATCSVARCTDNGTCPGVTSNPVVFGVNHTR